MMLMKLKTSVCMATYNGEKYIYKQLKSILSQSLSIDEIIIIDDSSIDKTVDIIKQFKDKRITLYRNSVNKGFLKTFEKAISCATGDIIFLSDQDDIWCEKKVSIVVDYFMRNQVDVICHDACVINQYNEIIYKSFMEIRKITINPYKNFIANSFSGCCLAFRAKLKDEILPIPSSVVYHDRWIAIISGFANYKLAYIKEKLIFYIRHDRNASPFKRQSLMVILKDRIILSIMVLKRITRIYLNRFCSKIRSKYYM